MPSTISPKRQSSKMRFNKLTTTFAVILSLLTAGLPVINAPESAAAATTIPNLPARWDSISSPGTGTTCALAKNGTIWCWGKADGPRGVTWDVNQGDPASGSAVTPQQVGSASNWTKVLVANSHACALNNASEVWCWGSNTQGQLGVGNNIASQVPVLVKAFGKKWTDFSVSKYQTCAIAATNLWCWGIYLGENLNLPTFADWKVPVINATSELQIGQVIGILTNGRLFIKTNSGNTSDFAEISAGVGQTWNSFQVRTIAQATGAGFVDTRMFSFCGILSTGRAKCYNKYDFAQVTDLGDRADWKKLASLTDAPREPLCGIRGSSTLEVECYSAYGSSNSTAIVPNSIISACTSADTTARLVDYPNFTNSSTYTWIPYSSGGCNGVNVQWSTKALTYSGTLPATSSIALALPENRIPASLSGGWFQGSVASQNAYSVWGRMYALTEDGRIYAIGDGKYGERQDGLPNGTVTDTWAPALTQPPAISGLNRSLVPKTGGARVVLSGSFLVGVTAVTVGSTSVDTWTESADGTALTFTSPASAVGGTVAVNVVTTGGTVTYSSALTYGDSPSAPTITGVQPANGGAVVNWSQPSSAGSGTITSYTVTASPGGQTCTWTVGPLSCTIAGLSNGSAYRVSILATSEVGPGSPSAPSALFTPYKSASAPTITSVAAGDTSVTVSWSAPNNNGSPITRYDAEAQPGGSSCSTTGTGSSCTITGLTNGTSYTINVYATNEAGSGDTTVWPTGVTPRTMAGAPTLLAVNAGDKQLSVSWRAPSNNGGSPVQSYTVTAQPGSVTCTAVAPSTTCNLLGLSNGSVYTVTVVATNPAGDSLPSGALTSSPLTIPGKPTISAVEPGANNVLVRWRAPAITGGASVTNYTVVASPGGGSCSTAGTEFFCVISGLDNGVTYAFTVTATNSAGVGAASNSYNGIPAASPGAPRNVSATPNNSGVTVTWAAPSYDGGTAVTGYIATVRATGDTCTVAANVFTCAFTPANGVTLANGTSYIVDVAALNNAGVSATTASNSVTPRTVATAPTQVGLTPGAGKIRVSWAEPASDGGSSVTAYVAVATPGSFTCTSVGNYCDLVGLTASTAYAIRVYAVNAAGAGAQSTAITATPFTTPTAPTSVAISLDDTSLNVSWAAPTSNGGSEITSYTATASPGGFTCTSPSNTFSCSIRGLNNGTQYTVSVTAKNLAGEGSAVTAAGKFVPRGVPNAPVLKSVDSLNQSLLVKWVPLSGVLLNGAAVSKYTATASPSGRFCTVDGSTAAGVANSSCTITGLMNGVAQTVTVVAAHDGGTSASSNGILRAARSAPSAPVGVSVSMLDGALSVTWEPPVDNGGVIISGFTVTATPNLAGAAGSTCVPQSGDSRGCVVSNLSNGTAYSVTVVATNDVGSGPASVAVTGIPASVPSAPTKIMPTVTSQQIALRWTASKDNGSPITSYRVVLQPGNYGCDVTDLSYLGCTVSGLDNGVPYSIAVYATNEAGDSPKGQVVGTVTPRAIPNAPAAVSASPTNGQVIVGWVPGFDGGSPIKQYLVVASPGGSQCTAVGTASQCVVPNLVNGTQYTFSVTAINDAGSSAPTLSSRVTVAGTPNAPVGLKVKPSDSSIAISFAPPAIDGGSPILNYSVYVNDIVECTVLPAKVLGCTVSDLENGTPQIVRVVANSAVGSSVSTPELVATPGRVSEPVTGVTLSGAVGGLSVEWTAPYDDGGSPITGYTVTLSPSGKTCKTDESTTSCDFTGLTAGTTYVAKVVALNGVGVSASSSSQPLKVSGVPTAVRSLSATPLSKSVKIFFASPSNNGGSAIVSYVFTVTGPNNLPVTSVEVLASKIKGSYTLTGLTKNVTYTVTVQATNEFGASIGVGIKVKAK